MIAAGIDSSMEHKYSSSRTPIVRPTWASSFMSQAIEIAKRSPDGQTKHGAIFTDMEHHVLAQGYNAPPKGMPDYLIPNLRPEKYKFFLHSEINAIINATVPLWSIKDGVRVYVTGIPCVYCTCAMINCNVKEIYFLTDKGWHYTAEEELERNFLIYHSGIKMIPFDETKEQKDVE